MKKGDPCERQSSCSILECWMCWMARIIFSRTSGDTQGMATTLLLGAKPVNARGASLLWRNSLLETYTKSLG